MKNIKMKALQNGALFTSILFLLVFPWACSEKPKNAEVDTKQTAVLEEAKVDEKVETTPTGDNRPTYKQPKTAKKSNNKVVFDASSTSFKSLDTDGNRIVNKEEFYNGLYTLLDKDGNNAINEEEFNKQKTFLSSKQTKLNSFKEWDSDGSKELSKDEFKNKLASLIDVPETERLAQNLYIVWDTDNDKKIEKLELEKIVIRFDPDEN